VSNRGMRQTIFIVTSLLLTFRPCAQDQSADQTERGAIQRVKTLLVFVVGPQLVEGAAGVLPEVRRRDQVGSE